MATIFRATDLRTGRQVAIKVPHLEAESDLTFFERFRREQEIGQRLAHPGIVRVFSDDEGSRSRVYMVMEWAEGKLLRQVLSEQGKLPSDRAVRIARQMCDALEYIHRNGVVHRDLKPENIVVDADDRIKLIDFGIAADAASRRLTFGRLSNTMGTPDYISPEQVQGKRGDARSDVYAVGVMLYEMLTGRTPFDGVNSFAIMNARLLRNAPSVRDIDPAISPELAGIVVCAMARDPRHRHATAQNLAWDLEHQEQVLPNPATVANKRPWWRPAWPGAAAS